MELTYKICAKNQIIQSERGIYVDAPTIPSKRVGRQRSRSKLQGRAPAQYWLSCGAGVKLMLTENGILADNMLFSLLFLKMEYSQLFTKFRKVKVDNFSSLPFHLTLNQ